MTSKKKAPRGSKGPSGHASASKESEAFFRPFANLPKAPAPKEPDPKASKTPAQPAKRPAPPTSKPKANQPPAPDPDEMLTFERLMAGVTPLQEGVRRVSTSASDVRSRLDAEARAAHAQQEANLEEQARARLHALVEEGSRFEVMDDGRRIDGRRRGVDGGLVRRMRIGELPIDATLDLHGMRVDEARQAVESFVRDRRTKGDRVVLLVHGRGRNSPTGQSVLRGEVAAWLSEGTASNHVSAFCTAPDEHGGEGAMCVLLAQNSVERKRL